MAKRLEGATAPAQKRVPVLWCDNSWTVRISLRPGPEAAALPAAFRWAGPGKNRSLRDLRWSGSLGARCGLSGNLRLTAKCARHVGAVVSLPGHREPGHPARAWKGKQLPEQGGDIRRLKLVRALAGRRRPLLALAALPLGSPAPLHFNIRHLFDNTQADSL